MDITIFIGIAAVLILSCLIVLDRKAGLNSKAIENISRLGISKDASERLFSTLKGFLVIFALALILGAALSYTQ